MPGNFAIHKHNTEKSVMAFLENCKSDLKKKVGLVLKAGFTFKKFIFFYML